MAKRVTVKIGPEIDKKLYTKFSKLASENGQTVTAGWPNATLRLRENLSRGVALCGKSKN
jgi:hypothetical protein